jgi:hypothetical protein
LFKKDLLNGRGWEKSKVDLNVLIGLEEAAEEYCSRVVEDRLVPVTSDEDGVKKRKWLPPVRYVLGLEVKEPRKMLKVTIKDENGNCGSF